VEILPSARKHNVGDDDMVHAFENCFEWVEIGEDPIRYLTAGPDLAGMSLSSSSLLPRTLNFSFTQCQFALVQRKHYLEVHTNEQEGIRIHEFR
jgi:hypothetical protein